MGRVAGVFDNPPGFPCTPPGVDILEGGKLTSNNVAGSSHDPLQSPAFASGAVSKPGGDAAGQDALHSAGVEGSEDSVACSKLPQPSQEEEMLMCLLQHCICVSRPCEILGDVNAEELKAAHPLHRCLVDGDGCVDPHCSGSSEAGSTEQMCSLTSFSKHLLKMGVRAMGLQSFKHVILFFFGMGTMMDFLKHEGTTDRERDRLKMSVKTPASWKAHAFASQQSSVVVDH